MNPVSSGIKACSPAGIVLWLPLLVSLLHLSSCLDLSGGGGVQLLSHVRLFVTPWTAVHHAPLSSNIFWILLRFMSTESWSYWTLSSSAAPFSFCLQSFPASGSLPVSWLFTSGRQSIGASALASVLPMIHGWLPWGLTGLISLQSKGFLRVFSSTSFLEVGG